MFGPEQMNRLTEREKNVMFDPNLDPNLTISQEYRLIPQKYDCLILVTPTCNL